MHMSVVLRIAYIYYYRNTSVIFTRAELSVIFTTQVLLWVFLQKNHTTIHVLYSAVYTMPPSCHHKIVGTVSHGSADGWPLNSIPIHSPLMLPYSILLCVERCGLIAHWAKLVFPHLGKQSQLGANAVPCGSVNGVTMADRLRMSEFNGIVQGDSWESLLNTATWAIFKCTVCVCTCLQNTILRQHYHSTGLLLCCFPSGISVSLVL